MDTQLLDKTLEDCIVFTIKKLEDICLAEKQQQEQLVGEDKGNVVKEEDYKWVELFVGEMSNATSVDDAKERAARVLAARDQGKKDQLKEKNLRLSQVNCVLKRAVVKQHERLKGFEEAAAKLSGMLSQCREELRVSEMNNYGIKFHLSQAQTGYSSSSLFNMSNKLPPDVY